MIEAVHHICVENEIDPTKMFVEWCPLPAYVVNAAADEECHKAIFWEDGPYTSFKPFDSYAGSIGEELIYPIVVARYGWLDSRSVVFPGPFYTEYWLIQRIGYGPKSDTVVLFGNSFYQTFKKNTSEIERLRYEGYEQVRGADVEGA